MFEGILGKIVRGIHERIKWAGAYKLGIVRCLIITSNNTSIILLILKRKKKDVLYNLTSEPTKLQ